MRFAVAFIIGLVLLIAVQVQAQSAGFLNGSESNSSSGSSNSSIDFYSDLTEVTRKSYIVGIRATIAGKNICNGVLISSQHVLVAGCRHKYAAIGATIADVSASGGEIIEIKDTPQNITIFDKTEINIYELTKPSTLSPDNAPYVGLRTFAGGNNVCYGTLIAPTYVATTKCSHRFASIGSVDNSGDTDISSYFSIIEDDRVFATTRGDRDVAIYKLKYGTILDPVKLLASGKPTLAAGTSLTTFGWDIKGKKSVISERNVDVVETKQCIYHDTADSDGVCTVAWLANDSCNIVNGSPLIQMIDGNHVLVGLRYMYEDACGTSGFPIAFTYYDGVMDWVKKNLYLHLV